ncbi:thioredoxin-dependent thiol peroxidase [Halobacterium litoreum]|uniref:thioredoxin-dependent peroxiredoxin n=1 Tax=Halobacterium litoreum TaxID=2039234 RepID=A0ABD5NIE7_9EURY|nr:thioredoxin-dependent thiol peroxidase [Halobacterium litoreum]UHH12303.1 thioredoxin-dependent thiol peroxidase [Halobacterium litoreum]
MLSEGDDAPDFELPNQDGEPVALSDYDDEYVVVYFYPRADTPGCTTEACSFRDRWSDYEEHGVTVLGVSDDSVEDLAAFKSKYDLPFDLLSDAGGEVATAYDSYGEREIAGDLLEVTFRNTFVVGPDGDVVAVFEGVDPEEHADEVLAAVA